MHWFFSSRILGKKLSIPLLPALVNANMPFDWACRPPVLLPVCYNQPTLISSIFLSRLLINWELSIGLTNNSRGSFIFVQQIRQSFKLSLNSWYITMYVEWLVASLQKDHNNIYLWQTCFAHWNVYSRSRVSNWLFIFLCTVIS